MIILEVKSSSFGTKEIICDSYRCATSESSGLQGIIAKGAITTGTVPMYRGDRYNTCFDHHEKYYTEIPGEMQLFGTEFSVRSEMHVEFTVGDARKINSSGMMSIPKLSMEEALEASKESEVAAKIEHERKYARACEEDTFFFKLKKFLRLVE